MLINIQPMILGVVFLWAGSFKVFSPEASASALMTVLADILKREQWTTVAYKVLGASELGMGLVLLLPPTFRWEATTALVLTIGFLFYLIWSRQHAPHKSCGCLGSRQTSISWKSIARASVLVLMSTSTLYARGVDFNFSWLSLLAGVGEFALVLWLSTEIDWSRLRKHNEKRPLEGDVSLVPDCATRSTPSQATMLSRLRLSPIYRQYVNSIWGGLVDNWREGCWHYFSFEGQYQGRRVAIVFAAPLDWHENLVRLAIVDAEEDITLAWVAPDLMPTPSNAAR